MQRVKDLLKSAERNRWLFYGDSITHGAKHTNGSRDFSELFRERVIWELQRKEDLVLNSAYSGFSTTNLLADFEWRAAAFKPNAAFVMIGCNDSKIMDAETFEKQLDKLFRDDAMDISSDVQVLENMLKKDGLSDDPQGMTMTF